MIDFLLGVPGKLKTISDYLTTNWTAIRAAKLDLLTVAPAPASTAVSNADYTSGRAAKLDDIEKVIFATPPIAANFGGGNAVTNSTSYVTALSVSGSGVLWWVGCTNTSGVAQIRVTIDGVMVLPNALMGSSSNPVTLFGCPVGPTPVVFKTSLLIEHKTNSVSFQTGTFWWMQRAT